LAKCKDSKSHWKELGIPTPWSHHAGANVIPHWQALHRDKNSETVNPAHRQALWSSHGGKINALRRIVECNIALVEAESFDIVKLGDTFNTSHYYNINPTALKYPPTHSQNTQSKYMLLPSLPLLTTKASSQLTHPLIKLPTMRHGIYDQQLADIDLFMSYLAIALKVTEKP